MISSDIPLCTSILFKTGFYNLAFPQDGSDAESTDSETQSTRETDLSPEPALNYFVLSKADADLEKGISSLEMKCYRN